MTTTAAAAEDEEAHLVETLEAVGEFDHGVGDMKVADKDHPAALVPPANLDMNKPKEMFLKAEKAVESAIKSSVADLATMEAVGEFDHGMGDFDCLYGKEPGEKDHPANPALDLNKSKEMFIKAEKVVEGAIRSVIQKTGSASKVVSESEVRKDQTEGKSIRLSSRKASRFHIVQNNGK